MRITHARFARTNLRTSLFGNSITPIIENLIDMGGWTTYTPKPVDTSTYNRTDTLQPGTRIYLHDWVSGNDAAAEYLLWNGTELINQAGSTTDGVGIAYGNDPLNPKGAVKPYKNFSYTGPRQNGAAIGTIDGSDQIGSLTFNSGAGRNGFPDWWLFKRGVTHPIYEDLLSWHQRSVPGATTTAGTLSVPGGESTTYRQVVGSWGPTTVARACITAGGQGGFLSRWPLGSGSGDTQFKNVHYVSLWFEGRVRALDDSSHQYLMNIFYGNSAMVDIVHEDCLYTGTDGIAWQLGTGGEFTLRRCVVLYTYSTRGFSKFLFTDNTGTPTLVIDDRLAILNGYEGSDPSITVPPNTVFDRLDYLSGYLHSVNSRMQNCVEMASGSAAQCRAGLNLNTCYFVTGGYTMGANGGNALANSGSVTNSVLQKWMDLTNSNANPGYGIGLLFGAKNVTVTGNFVTDQGLTSGEKTASASYGAFKLAGPVPTWPIHTSTPAALTGISFNNNTSLLTQNTVAHYEIVNGLEAGSVASASGYTINNTNGTQTWTDPGGFGTITQTMPTISGNTLLSGNKAVGPSTLKSYLKGAGTTAPCPEISDDTTYTGSGGTLYPNVAALLSAVPSATDPSRTAKRYMQEVLGAFFPVVVSKEGATEMAQFALARMQKNPSGGYYGYDDRFLGRQMRNWVVAGVGMSAV